MTTNLRIGDRFEDVELLDHNSRPVRLSHFTRPSLVDEKLPMLSPWLSSA